MRHVRLQLQQRRLVVLLSFLLLLCFISSASVFFDTGLVSRNDISIRQSGDDGIIHSQLSPSPTMPTLAVPQRVQQSEPVAVIGDTMANDAAARTQITQHNAYGDSPGIPRKHGASNKLQSLIDDASDDNQGDNDDGADEMDERQPIGDVKRIDASAQGVILESRNSSSSAAAGAPNVEEAVNSIPEHRPAHAAIAASERTDERGVPSAKATHLNLTRHSDANQGHPTKVEQDQWQHHHPSTVHDATPKDELSAQVPPFTQHSSAATRPQPQQQTQQQQPGVYARYCMVYASDLAAPHGRCFNAADGEQSDEEDEDDSHSKGFFVSFFSSPSRYPCIPLTLRFEDESSMVHHLSVEGEAQRRSTLLVVRDPTTTTNEDEMNTSEDGAGSRAQSTSPHEMELLKRFRKQYAELTAPRRVFPSTSNNDGDDNDGMSPDGSSDSVGDDLDAVWPSSPPSIEGEDILLFHDRLSWTLFVQSVPRRKDDLSDNNDESSGGLSRVADGSSCPMNLRAMGIEDGADDMGHDDHASNEKIPEHACWTHHELLFGPMRSTIKQQHTGVKVATGADHPSSLRFSPLHSCRACDGHASSVMLVPQGLFHAVVSRMACSEQTHSMLDLYLGVQEWNEQVVARGMHEAEKEEEDERVQHARKARRSRRNRRIKNRPRARLRRFATSSQHSTAVRRPNRRKAPRHSAFSARQQHHGSTAQARGVFDEWSDIEGDDDEHQSSFNSSERKLLSAPASPNGRASSIPSFLSTLRTSNIGPDGSTHFWSSSNDILIADPANRELVDPQHFVPKEKLNMWDEHEGCESFNERQVEEMARSMNDVGMDAVQAGDIDIDHKDIGEDDHNSITINMAGTLKSLPYIRVQCCSLALSLKMPPIPPLPSWSPIHHNIHPGFPRPPESPFVRASMSRFDRENLTTFLQPPRNLAASSSVSSLSVNNGSTQQRPFAEWVDVQGQGSYVCPGCTLRWDYCRYVQGGQDRPPHPSSSSNPSIESSESVASSNSQQQQQVYFSCALASRTPEDKATHYTEKGKYLELDGYIARVDPTPYTSLESPTGSLVRRSIRRVVYSDGHISWHGCTPTKALCCHARNPAYPTTCRNVRKHDALWVQTPPCCIKHFIRLYHYLVTLFEKHDVEWSLGFGTLLTALRSDGQLNPYDYDIDFLVYHKGYKQLKALVPQIEEDGYTVTWNWKSTCKQDCELYRILYKSPEHLHQTTIDIFLQSESDRLKHPFNETTTFLNRLARIPYNAEEYLDARYGAGLTSRGRKARGGKGVGGWRTTQVIRLENWLPDPRTGQPPPFLLSSFLTRSRPFNRSMESVTIVSHWARVLHRYAERDLTRGGEGQQILADASLRSIRSENTHTKRRRRLTDRERPPKIEIVWRSHQLGKHG